MGRPKRKGIRYCPMCIEPLIRDKKNLGGIVRWYICPICGFRERPIMKVIDKEKGIKLHYDIIRHNNLQKDQFYNG